MENHQTPVKNPSNFLESLSKDLRDAANKKNQIQGSPFTCLPHHTTPPSRFFATKNPFEAVMNEHIHNHIFSPSVFQEVKKSKINEKFKWTIDDMSSLNPANIDVTSTTQFELAQINSEEDVKVQAKIEKKVYFNETHIVPSPWSQNINQTPLLPETESPLTQNNVEAKNMCNVWTQTVLSLPPNLPEQIENALKPYFTFTEEQRRQTVDMNSSLCRCLFNFETSSANDDYSPSSHEELSVVGSPFTAQDSEVHKRHFDSSPEIENLIPDDFSPITNSTTLKLNDCPISPISLLNIENEQLRDVVHEEEPSISELSPIQLRKSCEGHSFAKMDFSGHMSVDNSFNMAPENDCVGVGNETNVSESPVRTNEFMESCNWDIEFNNVSLNERPIRRNLFELKQNSTERMDISNLTTPKSKIINSQRKKLSDSFKIGETLSDDEILNFDFDDGEGQVRKRINFCDKSDEADNNFVLSHNTQDTGYSTCPESSNKLNSSKEEDMVVSDISDNFTAIDKETRNPNIFASTPSKNSKRYFSELEK